MKLFHRYLLFSSLLSFLSQWMVSGEISKYSSITGFSARRDKEGDKIIIFCDPPKKRRIFIHSFLVCCIIKLILFIILLSVSYPLNRRLPDHRHHEETVQDLLRLHSPHDSERHGQLGPLHHRLQLWGEGECFWS